LDWQLSGSEELVGLCLADAEPGGKFRDCNQIGFWFTTFRGHLLTPSCLSCADCVRSNATGIDERLSKMERMVSVWERKI
jgi:hypothetical protein